ncbi:MAG: hypothetical protein VX733_03735 [Candidatus Latescibacterota bacterium]|nr:hypothetical protein [Candidatus Latescibacterota bacterium]
MSGTVLLGYDVETASESTGGFLEGAGQLHRERGTPWTIYLTGATAEARAADVDQALAADVDSGLLTVGQHTYNHILLKSVFMTPGDGKPVHDGFPNFFKEGGSLEQLREELSSTQQLLRERFGIDCEGLTGPWGYYRGLSDRPDLLGLLRDNGIRWVRSFARDSRDCQPTLFEEQPHFYEEQGFPEILELPVQGYQDDFYWDRFDDRRFGETYEDYLYAMLERVVEEDLVWSVCSHDHGTPTVADFDATKGRWLAAFIERGFDLGVRFAAPPEIYAELDAARAPGSATMP